MKITTTTHNDIICMSFNEKDAHSDPPIYVYMQKEDILSFPRYRGLGVCDSVIISENAFTQRGQCCVSFEF